VWFVGGTPDIVAGVYLGYDQPRSLGGYAQGGRISAPIWKQWALTALKGQPKVPFVAPPGIRWVRIDRASGKPVFGAFPTGEEAQSSVIWEAFQPQTEEQRIARSSIGDPYNAATQQQALIAWQQQQLELQQQRQNGTAPGTSPGPARPAVAGPPAAQPAAGLPTQNAL
jgi:penicillin-binding protein 1A